MKPKNFPGRKNIRRIEAVKRMKGNAELSETVAKIVDQSVALSTKTKKYRV